MSESEQGAPVWLRQAGFIIGLLAFASILIAPIPGGLSPQGQHVAAVAALMIVWWIGDVLPLPITSLLPILLFPSLGVMDVASATSSYADPLVFLLVGGFLIAAATERWGLHKRIALAAVLVVGTNPRRIVLGFMLGTAFVSMWITNTAATLMMLPVAVAILTVVDPDRRTHLGTSLILGVAYAASIGGVATLIGTSPNVIFAAAASTMGREVGFLEWMLVSLPLSAIMLCAAWLLLVRVLFVVKHDAHQTELVKRAVIDHREELGTLKTGEWLTAIVWGLTVFGWLTRSPKQFGDTVVPGLETWLPYVSDASIAMAGGLLLFLLPVSFRRMEFVLNWATAIKIPWGILWLLGGGLCLAKGFHESGLTGWIGGQVALLGDLSPVVVLLVVITLFLLLTEFTSNTATATVGMPLAASIAVGVGGEPFYFMAAVTYSVSMAFMLPVATPPNAIIFASGLVSMRQMALSGLALNLLSVALVFLSISVLFPRVFAPPI